MTTPTAMSTTLPFIAKSLNSLIIFMRAILANSYTIHMTAAKRPLRTAIWAAAGGFAFGWAAKGLATPPTPSVEPLPPLIAVAPQNMPVKAPEGGVLTEDG